VPGHQSLTTGSHETIIILPGGGIHAQGHLHEGPESPEVLIGRVCGPLRAAAVQHGQPIQVSIGHPDGHVGQHEIAVDGTIRPRPAEPALSTATDPVWRQGIPKETGLLYPVRAAQRAGQWRAAQQAAWRATQYLASQRGRDHPYAAMGLELQGYFALMARDHATGVALYTEAAVAIYQFGGPAAQARHNLAYALSAWLQSDRDTTPEGSGFALAHALVRVTPTDHAALAALLRRLTKDRS
jgi:hypothetical protein